MKNQLEIVLRLLDPRPLTSEEVEEHMEWGSTDTGTLINFHHPLYVGIHEELGPLPDDAPEGMQRLYESMDMRLKIRLKHEYIHDRPDPDPGRTIIMFERAYRPTAAYIMIRRGLYRHEPRELAEFIIDLWTDTESPDANGMWRELWRAFPMLGEPLGDVDLLDPSGTTTLYRGIAVPDEGDDDIDRPGYSWTTSRKVAEWFARRFQGLNGREIPAVLVGEVKNEHVLFCTRARNEDEVVSGAVTVTGIDYFNGVPA